MTLSLNRGTTGGNLSLPDFVKLAAGAGFTAADVDLGYASEHGTAALRDLYATAGIGFGAWGPTEWRKEEGQWKSDLPKLAKHAAIARELGIDACATWIMPSADTRFSETWGFHVSRLKETARVLAGEGRRLGLEFVAPYHLRTMFKHEFIFTPGLMLELAAEIGENVGLLVDCFHLHCAGVPASFVARMDPKKIVLAHINDAPKVPPHEVLDGIRLFPGEGAIDQKAFRDALKTASYAGPVSVEVFDRAKGMSPDESARAAVAACKASGWL